VQLFAVALARDGTAAPDLGPALLAAARATPQLDTASLTTQRSPSGRLSHARITHPLEQTPPRRYAAERDDALVLFDGFPIEQDGSFSAHDAAMLLERWDDLPGRLEGIFSAVRIDLVEDTVECLLDALGMARVFVHPGGRTLLISNSVEAIRVQAGLDAPDPLGVSSLLSLGYVARGRTLLAGVETLLGGGRHRFSRRRTTFEPYLTPASVLHAAPPMEALPRRLAATTQAAARSGAALRCGLTSGRDTRVLLALLIAAGVEREVDFYTSGSPVDLDVRIAQQLADHFHLQHRLLAPAVATGPSWAEQTTSFLVRTDGIANIELISDWLDHEERVDRLALEFWGGGGEVGRTSKAVIASLLATTPLLRRSYVGRRRLLRRRLGDPAGTLRQETVNLARQHLDAFVEQRRVERWPADALLEAFYAFEFLPARPGVGVRRASASADLFSPFVSRGYLEHCFSVSPGERYLESPHHALIKNLAPQVDVVPYQVPWRPQQPRFAWPLVIDDAARRLGRRLRRRTPPRESEGTPFYVDWYEAGLEQHRDLALSTPTSPLWDFVDRGRYEALLAATPQQRQPFIRSLCRVLSAFWYLHHGDGSNPAR
jgi:hypothetical protein